jgi:hypothetical protein
LFQDSIKKVGSFLYPGDDTAQWDRINGTNGGGGSHATTKDFLFRTRLYEMLILIDSVYFDGEINRGNSKFGCESEIQ